MLAVERRQKILANVEDRLPYLETFLKFAISELIKSSGAIFRPTLIFKHSEKLKLIMCGYQKAILKSAAIHAGALDAKFD